MPEQAGSIEVGAPEDRIIGFPNAMNRVWGPFSPWGYVLTPQAISTSNLVYGLGTHAAPAPIFYHQTHASTTRSYAPSHTDGEKGTFYFFSIPLPQQLLAG